jgi:exonuclease III
MEQSFSVLTYNVNFAGGRHEHESTADSIVLNAVVEAAADVVLMQETHVGWEALISQRAELAQAYPHRFFMDDGMKSAGGQSILSKVPVLQQREIKAPVQGSGFASGSANLISANAPRGSLQCICGLRWTTTGLRDC